MDDYVDSSGFTDERSCSILAIEQQRTSLLKSSVKRRATPRLLFLPGSLDNDLREQKENWKAKRDYGKKEEMQLARHFSSYFVYSILRSLSLPIATYNKKKDDNDDWFYCIGLLSSQL